MTLVSFVISMCVGILQVELVKDTCSDSHEQMNDHLVV